MRPHFLRRETLEPSEQEALRRLLDLGNAGELFLDVGAYHGAYARAAAGRGLETLCFEADPRNARKIRGHQVIRAVVSNDTSPVTFAARGSQVSGAADVYYSAATRYLVAPSVTLDGVLFDSNRVARLLKIDVEGFELKVVRGAERTLQDIRAALVEVHPAAMALVGDTPDELRHALEGIGLEVEVLDENAETGRAHWLAQRAA